MASLTTNPLSLKLALVSTGLVSMAVILTITVPGLTDFVPVMCSSVVGWLRPPYLYLVINGIIISIVASSKLQIQKDDDKVPDDLSGGCIDGGSVFHVLAAEERKFSEIVAPSKMVQRSESIEEELEKIEKEKTLVSKRFRHKKSVKANPEGQVGKATTTSLGVSKSKRHDTLENTWKMITDGRAMPLTRHMKKSDTWDNNPAPPNILMKKSDTFSEKKPSRQGSGKLRKEASLSQDELNRRVEAFISKFNEEMRLQRQESLNQYRQMIARGGVAY